MSLQDDLITILENTATDFLDTMYPKEMDLDTIARDLTSQRDKEIVGIIRSMTQLYPDNAAWVKDCESIAQELEAELYGS